jgi:Flp pilus assembly protein TadB
VSIWLKIKMVVAAAAVFAFWLLKGQLKRAKEEARAHQQRAEATEATRKVERKIDTERQAVQEESREVEREQQSHRNASTRPRTFGDRRLQDD